MENRLQTIHGGALWSIAIAVISAAVGMIVAWRAPGLSLQARDALMRARGPVPPSEEIVIVAIDEASIARFGRFPWPRSLMARAIDRIAEAKPKAIALDVLYSDATTSEEDDALATAIARAGNVVAAAQLIGEPDGRGERRANWLRPLPAIERAAEVAHVNIVADQDGVARTLLLRQMDDEAKPLWAMALETICAGEGADIRETPESVRIGGRVIPIETDSPTIPIATRQSEPLPETIRALRLTIDYAGPAGSFAPQTLSIADLVEGRVPLERLRGKYVLVGATANTMGDRLASPFARRETGDGDQHATLTPGVEILANSLHTILRARFHSVTPDWIAFLCAALVASAVFTALTLAQGRGEWMASLAALFGLTVLILVVSYLLFARWLIVPPVVPMLAALLTAAPLTLLRRTLAASADLDARIAELTGTSARMIPSANLDLQASPAPLIAQLAHAGAVAILRRDQSAKSAAQYRIVARHGAPLVPVAGQEDNRTIQLPQPPHGSITEALTADEAASRYFIHNAGVQTRALALELDEGCALLIAYSSERPPDRETLHLCRELVSNWLALATHEPEREESGRGPLRRFAPPRGLQWKARRLGWLQQRLLRRSGFVDRAMHSIEDGLLIAGIDGAITFANPRAGQIFGLPEQALIGRNLFHQALNIPAPDAGEDERSGRLLHDTLMRLLIDRAPVEREIAIGPEISGAPARHYTLRLAVVRERRERNDAVTGIVATLSDITRQRELQQMKNDVMALVTHELRTPITAIQGMSEVLAAHEFSAGERREMHQAINEEARRLARMIDDYLDVARLESGARPLRRSAVRVSTLVERALLMLEPVAEQRRTRILRRFAPNLPSILADADLLARAVTNLVANAIKYSPPGSEVIVETGADERELRIKVADHGHGIPANDLERIFEKFYRVPRVEDAGVPGTGLGLAFVREVAELHGGRVTVESETGVGSVFTLHLPLSRG